MSTKWSHLPNAHLIDWVLKSLKTDPNAWDAAWGEVAREAARDAARDAAREVAWDAWYAVWDALYAVGADAAWEAAAAWAVAREAEWAAFDAARADVAARFAILALIADDNAAQYLHMESDKLKVWAILSEKPAAVLLIPANKIWQQEHARAENALQYN